MALRPAKTQISLGIRPVWSVFAVRMKKAWVLSYPFERTANTLIRLGRCPGSNLGASNLFLFCLFLSVAVVGSDPCLWLFLGIVFRLRLDFRKVYFTRHLLSYLLGTSGGRVWLFWQWMLAWNVHSHNAWSISSNSLLNEIIITNFKAKHLRTWPCLVLPLMVGVISEALLSPAILFSLLGLPSARETVVSVGNRYTPYKI